MKIQKNNLISCEKNAIINDLYKRQFRLSTISLLTGIDKVQIAAILMK